MPHLPYHNYLLQSSSNGLELLAEKQEKPVIPAEEDVDGVPLDDVDGLPIDDGTPVKPVATANTPLLASAAISALQGYDDDDEEDDLDGAPC